MSYIVPSVQVYQQLANSGGVANTTPDLIGCVIGPCNNVVSYDTTDAATLLTSTAVMTAGSTNYATGINLTAAETVYLPSTQIGQIVDPSSVAVYLNNVTVTTGSSRGAISPTWPNRCYISGTPTTATTTAFSKVVTTLTGTWCINDMVTLTGAGSSGADLTTFVTQVAGQVITLNDPVKITGTTVPITRIGCNNTNYLTGQPIVNVGDTFIIDDGGAGDVQTTTITSLDSFTAGAYTYFVHINVADNFISAFTPGPVYNFHFRNTQSNQLLPATFQYNGATINNYDLTNVAITGAVVLVANPQFAYGTAVTGDVHIVYSALRQDLNNQILDIPDNDTLLATLGQPLPSNPLALGVQLALANTTTSIKAVAVSSNDLTGYTSAFQLLENYRVYALTVLTQSLPIIEALQVHVQAMSTPVNAAWRMCYVNTAIPQVLYLAGSPTNVNNGAGISYNATLGGFQLIDTTVGASFITDGIVPGDTITITNSVDSTATHFRNWTLQVVAVQSNNTLNVTTPTQGTPPFTSVSYYVSRNLSAYAQANDVAAASTGFNSNRVVHVQPDLCGVVVGGITTYLPGYYLCCALVGLTAGLPAQQGLTNIGLAGISDLEHSNFYFTRAQLDTMAGAGTLLLVQQYQGGLPYVRHSLTTDMSVLQYREVQQVKNIDFVSYYFFDILSGFPGNYNITPDTLQTLRTSINAGGNSLMGRKLPKIGAPLLGFSIQSLAQDATNQDQVDVTLPILIPTVMNYVNIYLVI